MKVGDCISLVKIIRFLDKEIFLIVGKLNMDKLVNNFCLQTS